MKLRPIQVSLEGSTSNGFLMFFYMLKYDGISFSLCTGRLNRYDLNVINGTVTEEGPK